MKKITEWCSSCDNEVELDNEFKRQICPLCNEVLLPCCLCDMDKVECTKCPLDKRGQ